MPSMWNPEGRRSSIQIIAEILRLLRPGKVSKTEITCNVNMSYYQVQRYLKRLLELGSLDEVLIENNMLSYRATRKGLRLLAEIETVQEMLRRSPQPAGAANKISTGAH